MSLLRNTRWRLVLLTIGVLAAGLWLSRDAGNAPATRPLATTAQSRQPRTPRPLRDFGSLSKAGRVDIGIRGRVTSEGAPVAGARVCAACAHCEMSTARAAPCSVSDGDGIYLLAGLAPHAYYVHASAEDRIPGTANRGAPVVVTDELVEEVDIELPAGGALLTGTVLDATGGPIAGARVRAVRALPPIVALDSVTDADGRFRFPLREGFIEIVASADDYARGTAQATAPGHVELRLVPGSSVEGVVISSRDGEPLANVEVKALAPKNPRRALAEGALSDADGRFRIRGLEPGTYTLAAIGEGARGDYDQPLQLGLADHRDGVVIELNPAASITGRVLLEGSGEPCREGHVALGQPSPHEPLPSAEEFAAVTGGQRIERATGPGQVAPLEADGTARFPAVPPGYYFVQVSCRRHRLLTGPRLLHVTDAPVAEPQWTVAPAAAAVVRVVDGRGQPVERADFYVEFPSRGPRVISAYRSDAEGLATIEDLQTGRHKLHAPDGYAEVPSVAFEVDERSTELHLTLTLPGSGFVLASVETEAGEPLDGLHVAARRALPGALLGETAAARRHREVPALALGRGRYRMGPLQEGPYAITVADGVNPRIDGNAQAGSAVQVSAAHATETRIVLRRGGALEGTVVDEYAAPTADVWVSVSADGPDGPAWFGSGFARGKRVLTDAEGQFSLTGLAPDAAFRVVASEPEGRRVAQRDVHPGDRVVLQLPAMATRSSADRPADD